MIQNRLITIGLLASLTCLPPALYSARTTIMPLGDSITSGKSEEANYRVYLYQMLVDSGYSVDYVGSLKFGSSVMQDFDPDHEGHYGWRTDEILGSVATYTAYQPDIVLCHLGTNDFGKEEGTISERAYRTIGEIDGIIHAFRAVNPGTVFLVAKIIPDTRNGAKEFDSLYNSLIDSLAKALDKPTQRVIAVDHYTSFDARTQLMDGVHPNVSGSKQMAKVWYENLLPFLTRGGATGVGRYHDLDQDVSHYMRPLRSGSPGRRRVNLQGRAMVSIIPSALPSVKNCRTLSIFVKTHREGCDLSSGRGTY